MHANTLPLSLSLIHKHTYTHSYISQEIGWQPKVRSEDVVVVNIAWYFWRMAQALDPEKNSPHFLLLLVPLANRQNITHLRARPHAPRQERPIRFRSYCSPVSPLRRSSPLLLMIFLILRKETEVRGCPLISTLWTSSGCGCYWLLLCPLKLAHTHTHTLTHTHAHISLLPRTDMLA